MIALGMGDLAQISLSYSFTDGKLCSGNASALREEADCLHKSIQHLVKLIEESKLGIPT